MSRPRQAKPEAEKERADDLAAAVSPAESPAEGSTEAPQEAPTLVPHETEKPSHASNEFAARARQVIELPGGAVRYEF